MKNRFFTKGFFRFFIVFLLILMGAFTLLILAASETQPSVNSADNVAHTQ